MVTSVYMCEKLDGEGMGGLNFKRRIYLDILIKFRGIYDPFLKKKSGNGKVFRVVIE